MLNRVLDTITRYRMFAPGQRVGVAVSGGADSVCLLHLLNELAPRWDLRLTVLHLDHQLRGEESHRDAEFVRELAASFGLPFELGETDVSIRCQDEGENLEQAARAARLAFFHGFLASGRLDRIAVGHTRSDQAETVLFRFLRGSGTAGLAGIRPVTREGIVRPLLDIDRSEIEQYLRDRGIPWREDSSNATREFARNRIRHELLPQLTRDWNPTLPETLAHMASWAQGEESYWDREIARLEAAHLVIESSAVLLRIESLAVLPRSVARRLLRRAIELAKGDLRSIGFQHIEGILKLAASEEGHGRLQIPGLDIFRSFEWLRLAPPSTTNLEERNYRVPLLVPGTARPPGQDFVIHAELSENTAVTEMSKNVYNKEMGRLDWNRISGSLEVRNWRPGDQYQPAGHAEPQKIKLLFHEARVPLWERRYWPIVVSGEQILWTRQFGAAAGFIAGPDATSVLSIRETRE